MRCPYCGNDDTQVKDSRPTEDSSAIRRRRHARIVHAGCASDADWKDPRVLGTSMSTADTQMAHLGEASGGPLARSWTGPDGPHKA